MTLTPFIKANVDPIAVDIRRLFEEARVNYLSARDNPKTYKKEWVKFINKLKDKWDDRNDLGDLLRNKINEGELFADDIVDPQSTNSQHVYEAIKNLRNDGESTKDPFKKKYGDKLIDVLAEDIEKLAVFLHWSFRENSQSLPVKSWKKHSEFIDDFTNKYPGLDLTAKQIIPWLSQHYGDDNDLKRIKTKYRAALSLLEEVFMETSNDKEWDRLLESQKDHDREIKKSDDDEREQGFMVPNKPMYRIFNIEDIEELKGFTGNWLVQEKFDGMRIQIHKENDSIKIYSFKGREITDRFPKQKEILSAKHFGDCILDAEAVLYKEGEPLHRAETIAYVNGRDEGEVKIHVFDIMKHEEENVSMNKLDDRFKTLQQNFAPHSDDYLQFPNKQDSRIADNLDQIAEYAKEIMENPTSEGVVIKDLASSYVVGKKKNPKWIKWKKFVDLDLIILDKRENKNGTFSYTLGAGPIGEDVDYGSTVEINNESYINVGKALNTKKELDKGSIVRVKVDEVKKKGKGYSIYNALIIEIPEVDLPDKVITLQLLAEGNKKSLGDYKVQALEKGYTITDDIHGEAILKIGEEKEEVVLYGFDENNLMAKHAIIDLDIWRDDLAKLLKDARSEFLSEVKIFIEGLHEPEKEYSKSLDEIWDYMWKNHKRLMQRNFKGDKEKQRKDFENRLGRNAESYGLDKEKDEVTSDTDMLDKKYDTPNKLQTGKFIFSNRKDGDINFCIYLGDNEMSWRIEQDESEDYNRLIRENDKFRSMIDDKPEKEDIMRKGKVTLGSQRNGFHEYILKGDQLNIRLLFRIVPIDNKDQWVVFRADDLEPTSDESDEGVWNINEDRYNTITYLDKTGKPLYINETNKE